MYDVYKEASTIEKRHVIVWRKFKATRQDTDETILHYETFMRIGIRKDPTIDELKSLAGYVTKRFIVVKDLWKKMKIKDYYNYENERIKERIKMEIGRIVSSKKPKRELPIHI